LSLATERRGRFFTVSASIVLVLLAMLALVSRAQATETVFWDNYSGEPESIGYSDISGAGGGALNLSGVDLAGPEGMAYDSVTGRIFVAGYESGLDKKGQIIWANINGSGGGVLNTTGAPVDEPMGVAVDPVNRLIYWLNTDGPGNGSIGFARLDGSGGGQLNTAGAPAFDSPYRLGFDPATGKLFWYDEIGTTDTIAFANVNGSGGGTLDLSGAPTLGGVNGFTVDSAAGRLYWTEGDDLNYVSVNGGSGGTVNLTGADIRSAYGLALDPANGTVYWGNYDSGDGENAGAIGFVRLSGGGGSITPSPAAPVKGPQDPVIVKSPAGTGAPAITRSPGNRAELTCSSGSWGADAVGGNVYQAPNAFAYQWLRNGAPITGATAPTLAAQAAGQYSCTVTGSNPVGSAAQVSAVMNVKASKFKVTTKKKAKADAGDLVTFKVKAVNQGDLKPKNAKLCVKLPKAAKDDLKAPKCKKLGLKGGAKKTLTLKVKVKPAADEGTDKLTFQVKGTAGKAAKSKITVR